MSRIEQLIIEMEEYIDGCKPYPLSNTKIVVNKEELDEYVGELRRRMPQEIQKYKKLVDNKEAIIADAREQADAILNEAQVHTEELINEHEIMQRAYAQANETIQAAEAQAQEILNRATEEANNVRAGAMQYTDDILANLQIIIEHSVETNKAKYGALISALEQDLNIVINNRNELRGEEPAEDVPSDAAEQ